MSQSPMPRRLRAELPAKQKLEPQREPAPAPRPITAASREGGEFCRTLYESIPLMFFQLDRQP